MDTLGPIREVDAPAVIMTLVSQVAEEIPLRMVPEQ